MFQTHESSENYEFSESLWKIEEIGKLWRLNTILKNVTDLATFNAGGPRPAQIRRNQLSAVSTKTFRVYLSQLDEICPFVHSKPCNPQQGKLREETSAIVQKIENGWDNICKKIENNAKENIWIWTVKKQFWKRQLKIEEALLWGSLLMSMPTFD